VTSLSPAALTVRPGAGSPLPLLTWTTSVPTSVPNSPTGGDSRLSSVTGCVPFICGHVTVVVSLRYCTASESVVQLTVPLSSRTQSAREDTT
jgi:hypothetical protein